MILSVASSAWADVGLPALLERSGDEHVRAKVEVSKLSAVGCNLKLVKVTGDDPLTHKPRSLRIKDYRPLFQSSSTKLKTVLLMPPTGGENFLDWAYANHLCFRGMRVVLVSGWDFQDESSLDPIMHDRGAVRAISAMRHAVDYIKPERPGQLGVLGTSVGAISAALGMALDERITAGFFIVGGGGIVDIIAESTEETLTKLRKSRMESHRFTSPTQYRDLLANSLQIDPLDYAPRLQNRPTSYVIAKQDLTVPTRTQVALLKASGSNEVLYLNGNHLDVIIATAKKEKSRVTEFFKRTLR